jgi:transferrin binding protein
VKIIPLTCTALAACALSACGGGGGGTRPSSSPEGPAAPIPDGANRDLTTLSTPTATTVGSVSRLASGSGAYSPQVTFSNAPSVRIVIPSLSVDDTFTLGDVVSTTVLGGVQMPTLRHTGSGSVRTFTYIVPSAGVSGLRFSSLGVWDRADITTGVIGETAAISFGSRTLGSDVPNTGTAKYQGFVLGNAIESAGQQFSIIGQAIATADFGARSISFVSTNSSKTDRATGVIAADAGYNLSGTLAYASGSNTLGGSLSTANGKSGPAAGAFYGPQAAEMGATFSLTGPGGTQPFVGGAGLKKQ